MAEKKTGVKIRQQESCWKKDKKNKKKKKKKNKRAMMALNRSPEFKGPLDTMLYFKC